ncbi:MAG: type II toxin-antitoxin system prevent-host-death family antitoxin [Dehalococcoidia bacterium]
MTRIEQVTVEELKQRAKELVRRVHQSGETFEVTVRGRVAALLRPPPKQPFDVEAWIKETDEIAAQIGALWPAGVSAEEAVREQRREL